MIELLTQTEFSWAANHTIAEFLAGYIFGAALIIGAPAIFFLLAFMSALQNKAIPHKDSLPTFAQTETESSVSIYQRSEYSHA